MKTIKQLFDVVARKYKHIPAIKINALTELLNSMLLGSCNWDKADMEEIYKIQRAWGNFDDPDRFLPKSVFDRIESLVKKEIQRRQELNNSNPLKQQPNPTRRSK